MDQVNSLTTESAVRKIIMAAIVLGSYIWFQRKGTHPDPTFIGIITETVLPAILAPVAVVVDTARSWMIHKQASHKIDAGKALAGVTGAEIDAVVDRGKELKADPERPDVKTTAEGIELAAQEVAGVKQIIPGATVVQALNAAKGE